MKELLERTREVLSEAYRGTFPVVMKSDRDPKQVVVIYRDHSEWYKYDSAYRGDKDSQYDPYNEIEMARGNGMRRVDFQGRDNEVFVGEKGTSINDVVGLLEDIIEEFGAKEQITLSTERIEELLQLAQEAQKEQGL
jgi:hypothetical protein